MNKGILIFQSAIFLLLHFTSCNRRASLDTRSIASDSASIANGHVSFKQNCSTCHNFTQEGIGPPLGGLTSAVPVDWIRNFIKGPKTMIESGDERAQVLIVKYDALMPSFGQLPEEEINEIIAFLHTQKAQDHLGANSNLTGLANPIPQPIALSDLVVELKVVTQLPPSSERLPRTRITKLDFQPNTDKLFILDLRGKLYYLNNNHPVVYMDIAKLRAKFMHKPGLGTGFGSFAFHPDFSSNGLLYTTHCEPVGSATADFSFADSIKVAMQWVIMEWKTKQPSAASFSGEGRELFRVNMVFISHGVQEITFNPLSKPSDEDYGLLYIGIGDGGSAENGHPLLTHSLEKIWGTILRIDPLGRNSANGQYGIPKHNPFIRSDSTRTRREIYAYGFRNPHRITWSKSGQMLACNIGHINIESLNLIMPGHDYGWPVREGTFVLNPLENMSKIYPLPSNDSISDFTYPVAQYDHDEGKAISGGFEYTGKAVPALAGKYLFGDIPTGKLFFVELKDLRQGKQAQIRKWQVSLNGIIKTLGELCGTDRVDLHFGRDRQGELYILTKPDGKVYKLVSAAMKHTNDIK